MLPIRTLSIDTAGTLYPSLCPNGYDPIMESDTRVASAVVAKSAEP